MKNGPSSIIGFTHLQWGPIEFQKFKNKQLDRQIDEAMRIKHSRAEVLMNSGAEWRQVAIPRATFSAPGLERRQETRN